MRATDTMTDSAYHDDETLSIDRKKLSEKGDVYDRLYRRGIDLLQRYCGARWTDYNRHDPGVTILEQLCYALSELYYKATFPVEDYFTGLNGGISYSRQALLHPDQVLPNGCITASDLRRLLFDRIYELGNVWVERSSTRCAGLLTVYASVADQFKMTATVAQEVEEKIRSEYSKWRNCSEDIDEIVVLQRLPLVLEGEIRIRSTRSAEELYGEIYAVCAEYIACDLRYRSPGDLKRDGWSIPEIFDGPPMEGGIVPEEELDDFSRVISVAEMTQRVSRIEGVEEVVWLGLRCGGKLVKEGMKAVTAHSIASLYLPQSNDERQLKLLRLGNLLMADWVHVMIDITRRLRNDRRYPEYRTELRRENRECNGTYRHFDEYHSIQSDFPDVYGINDSGVPADATPERRAAAKQLKAYLWLFEQMVADAGAALRNVRHVLSVSRQRYRMNTSMYLDNSTIPGIEELYVDRNDVKEALDKSMKAFDRLTERRSDALDVMLGIYGLEFDQVSLRNFSDSGEQHGTSAVTIENKLRLLRYAGLVTSRSGKGVDYGTQAHTPHSMSGIELLLHLRIGNDPRRRKVKEAFIIIEHVLLRYAAEVTGRADDDFYCSRISAVFPGFRGRYVREEFRALVEKILLRSVPAHLDIQCIWCDEQLFDAVTSAWLDWRVVYATDPHKSAGPSAALQQLLDSYRGRA